MIDPGRALVSRLRRVTRDGRWIPEIDGLRFFAIAVVLLYHFSQELGPGSPHAVPLETRYSWLLWALSHGDRGVGVFFAISGMILALPFGRQILLGQQPVSLRKYYLRRVTRLEPPYLLSIVVVVLMEEVYRGWNPEFLRHALVSSLYLHNVWFGRMSTVNSVYWSLEVEIQFYLLAPLIMQIFRIRGKKLRRGLILSFILAAGILQIPFLGMGRFQLSIPAHIQHFAAGLLVADVYLLDSEQTARALLWDLAGISAIVALLWMPRTDAVSVPIPLLETALCFAALRGGFVRRFFSRQWVAIVGGMCYSIYLLHWVLMAAIFKVTWHALTPRLDFLGNFVIQLAVTVLPALILCAVFFLLVERPCMDPNWPGRLGAWLRGNFGEYGLWRRAGRPLGSR